MSLYEKHNFFGAEYSAIDTPWVFSLNCIEIK